MVWVLEGFADAWGGQYLMTAYHFDKNSAAELVAFIFIGMLFGGPLLAALSKTLNNYLVISWCGIFMSETFSFLILNLAFN